MNPLNLSRFKKVSETETHATLKHPHGHEIKILKAPLSNKMRAQIKSLPFAEGGDVNKPKLDQSQQEPSEPKQDLTPIGKRINYPGMANGGDVSDNDIIEDKKKTDDYNAVHEDSPKEYSQNVTSRMQKTDITPKRSMPMFAKAGLVDPANLPHVTPEGEILGQNDGADQFNLGAISPAILPTAGLPDQVSNNQVSLPDAEPLRAPAAIESNPPIAEQAMPQSTTLDAQEGTATANPPTQPGLGITSGYDQQLKGLGQEQQAASALGNQEAAIMQRQADSKAEALKTYQDSVSKLETERQHSMQDVKDGFVKPEHYWENHSKVATGLGLILAGFNPANTPNAALEFLKSNIERDTEAQKANLGAKNNLLAHTVQQFGNVRDAATFANVLKSDQMAAELQTAAAKAKDPMAQARLNQLAGQLTQQFYPQYLGLQMKQAMIQASQQPDGGGIEHMLPIMRMMAPEQAKEFESRLLPGLGPNGSALQTTVPVTPEVRHSIASQNSLIQATSRLRDWIAKNGSDVSKLDPAKRAQAQTLSTELQGLYRQSIGASTSEGEKNTIQSIINDQPLNLFSKWGANPKLMALESSMRDRLDDNLKTLGVKQGAERPAQTKTVNGITYRRGPQGQAIRVK